MLAGTFGGVRPVLEATNLDATRAFPLMGREQLLEGRAYDERTVEVPGPAGPVTLSVLRPRSERHAATVPGLFWIHGGGMVAGTRWAASAALDAAEAVGGVVTSLDHRLAPEHPAPAPLEDCYAALCWVADHAAALGIDAGRLVVGGTSAGGGLAAATALWARDHDGPPLAGLFLCCPMLDDRMATPSSRLDGEAVTWAPASNRFGWASLLGDRVGTSEVSIYEAPGRATDLSGLPPTYVDVGSADVFRDEDVAFASTIWASGGAAELHVWPGGYHGFELLAPGAAISVDAVEARRRWMARTVGERRG